MTEGFAWEGLLRELAPQALGALVRRFGDFAAAEDAVQEALLAAARQWPKDGLPASPRGLPVSDCVTSSSTREALAVGSDSTSGAPLSPPSRSRTSIGTCPSSGTDAPSRVLSDDATAAPPPEPNTSIRSSQCGHSR